MSLLSLTTYRDLLSKCIFDYKKLQCCTENPEYEYQVFNCVVGLNHLFEWYLKDNGIVSEEQKRACLILFNPYKSENRIPFNLKSLYQELSQFPECNEYQYIIRQICNKAKHFEKYPSKPTPKYISVMGEDNMIMGEANVCIGAYLGYGYTVESNGIDIGVHQLIGKLLEQWKLFTK